MKTLLKKLFTKKPELEIEKGKYYCTVIHGSIHSYHEPYEPQVGNLAICHVLDIFSNGTKTPFVRYAFCKVEEDGSITEASESGTFGVMCNTIDSFKHSWTHEFDPKEKKLLRLEQ